MTPCLPLLIETQEESPCGPMLMARCIQCPLHLRITWRVILKHTSAGACVSPIEMEFL